MTPHMLCFPSIVSFMLEYFNQSLNALKQIKTFQVCGGNFSSWSRVCFLLIGKMSHFLVAKPLCSQAE